MRSISDCMVRINQVLNYPSISYTDVSHYFDQAISELNTTLRIGLPLISEFLDEHRLNIVSIPNVVYLSAALASSKLPNITDVSEIPSGSSEVYYNTSDAKFYKLSSVGEPEGYATVFGIYIDSSYNRQVLQTSHLASGEAMWVPYNDDVCTSANLCEILPTDWIIMFLIPYVCFKFSVRDGSSGALYNEEYVQGFQQLQTSYDIPNSVLLSKVAHLPAYTRIAKDNLDNLQIHVPTRAIYDSMKIGNAVQPEYGTFYSGGWGL